MTRLLSMLLLAALCLSAWLIFSGAKQIETPKQPNILLVLLDDLGNSDPLASTDEVAVMPTLQQLATRSVRFDRHYADATCRPARASLLTGMQPSRLGFTPNARGISPEVETLPEVLRDHGYTTIHIGKWHLGDRLQSAAPDQQGFQEWFGFRNALETRHGDLSRPAPTYRNPYLRNTDDVPRKQEGHMTDLFTARAVETIKRLAGSEAPWFINLWYYAPHTPLEPAARFANAFPDSDQGRYLALLAQLDDAIGQVLNALDETDQRRDTLVVLVSDNGGTNRQRDSNAPYAGRKTQYLEGGLRTPLLLSARFLRPTTIEAPVFITDLMPTLLGMAGAPVPAAVTGRDLRPALDGSPLTPVETYFWDVRLPMYFSWGMLDLPRGLLYYRDPEAALALVQDWQPTEARFSVPRKASASEDEAATAAYRAWREEASWIPLEKVQDGRQWRRYRGDSYRRTPGFGLWTLQIPLPVDAGESVNVQQPGHFEIRTQGGDIRVSLPGHQFSVSTTEAGCQLLTLATAYNWRLRAPGKSRAYVSLFLGERELYKEDFPLQAPIALDEYPALQVSARGGEPELRSDMLNTRPGAYYRGPLDCHGSIP